MTKEVIKERIKIVLDGYINGAINYDQTIESIANIVIEGATVLALDKTTNKEKQEAESEFNNIITLKDGYKIRLKGYFSEIKMEKKC